MVSIKCYNILIFAFFFIITVENISATRKVFIIIKLNNNTKMNLIKFD